MYSVWWTTGKLEFEAPFEDATAAEQKFEDVSAQDETAEAELSRDGKTLKYWNVYTGER